MGGTATKKNKFKQILCNYNVTTHDISFKFQNLIQLCVNGTRTNHNKLIKRIIALFYMRTNDISFKFKIFNKNVSAKLTFSYSFSCKI